MRDLRWLDAGKILSVTQPERLFSQAPNEARGEYRELARQWHPDLKKSSECHAVFSHIVRLYRSAQKKVAEGSWVEPLDKIEDEIDGVMRFRTCDGSIKQVERLASRDFELGQVVIGANTATFIVRNEFSDLFSSGRKAIAGLAYADCEMAAAISPFMPQVVDSFALPAARVLVLRKTPDQLLLADVLERAPGRTLAGEHVGWILNVLLNICCYLQWSGTTHNGIAAQTTLISPLRHSGMLLGGWWYSARAGSRLSALPDFALDATPPDLFASKRADARIDLELVRALGREMLGDRSGMRMPPAAPRPMLDWLLEPAAGDARQEYAQWKNSVLPECFGAPRFVELSIDARRFYKEA